MSERVVQRAEVTPLEGVRVLDLTTYTPGPFGTQILADLGATVLKVERPGEGDPERSTVPDYWIAYNRGKRSVALDLKDETDRERCMSLAAGADIVAEGFRPGVVDRLGIGYGDVVARNPRVIYVSLSGFGPDGPLADVRAHDWEYQAQIGALALGPADDTGRPIRHSAWVPCDYASGAFAVIGVLALLARPELRPRHLQIPVAAAGLAWAFPKLLQARNEGVRRAAQPAGGIFPTSDGKFVAISAVENHVWDGLCRALERPDLARRDDLAGYRARRAHAEEINAIVEAYTSIRTRDECVEQLRAFGVAACPVNEPKEVFSDPGIAHWDILHEHPSPHMDLPVFGLPARRNVLPPELDQDGDAVRAKGWDGL